jgi:hypothetical protein
LQKECEECEEECESEEDEEYVHNHDHVHDSDQTPKGENKVVKGKRKRKEKKKLCNCKTPEKFIEISNKLEGICEHPIFEKTIIILILMNTFVLAIEIYDSPEWLI